MLYIQKKRSVKISKFFTYLWDILLCATHNFLIEVKIVDFVAAVGSTFRSVTYLKD